MRNSEHARSATGAPARDDVEAAAATLSAGRDVIIVDEQASSECIGTLVLAAEFATAARLSSVIRRTCGFIQVALTRDRANELGLPPLADADNGRPSFAVAVDAKTGITTGISAHDRAHTARLLAEPTTIATDLTRPGHIVPTLAHDNGLLESRGRAEAAVDLCRIAELRPVAVMCEILANDGTLPDRAQLLDIAAGLRLPVVTIDQLAEYRRRTAAMVSAPSCRLPTRYGTFQAHGYRIGDVEHLALVVGDVRETVPTTRIHIECLAGDALLAQRCDCGDRLHRALREVAESGAGVVVYLRGERGLHSLIAASCPRAGESDSTSDEVIPHPANRRQYLDAALILGDLGIECVHLPGGDRAVRNALTDSGIRILPMPAQAPFAHAAASR
ncbi:3,4-dihydroxy-2-butanone-4-phosphate synthase [Nocardia sp. CA2R105]|uniref:3,4-dihydroxy-2-butanone-4-phosphate synthase n=1 Tax=Nocardia coffeae TaxID=2873381 RepID=UPI001CA71AA0|nr:3,4-dihydroxy-2-butanone-4-phosphate synthase [Nocardia coffeae]MBY8856865.1 3,4-dihydroxy-2-butanone-4-phosphate synthase [Nocardia coffeae]